MTTPITFRTFPTAFKLDAAQRMEAGITRTDYRDSIPIALSNHL